MLLTSLDLLLMLLLGIFLRLLVFAVLVDDDAVIAEAGATFVAGCCHYCCY